MSPLFPLLRPVLSGRRLWLFRYGLRAGSTGLVPFRFAVLAEELAVSRHLRCGLEAVRFQFPELARLREFALFRGNLAEVDRSIGRLSGFTPDVDNFQGSPRTVLPGPAGGRWWWRISRCTRIWCSTIPCSSPIPTARTHGATNGNPLLVGTANTPEIVRSAPFNWLHFSEAAFYRSLSQLMTGAMQRVPNSAGSGVLVESTANGQGGDFYDLCQLAMSGRSSWAFVFFAYWEYPEKAMEPARLGYKDPAALQKSLSRSE